MHFIIDGRKHSEESTSQNNWVLLRKCYWLLDNFDHLILLDESLDVHLPLEHLGLLLLLLQPQLELDVLVNGGNLVGGNLLSQLLVGHLQLLVRLLDGLDLLLHVHDGRLLLVDGHLQLLLPPHLPLEVLHQSEVITVVT